MIVGNIDLGINSLDLQALDFKDYFQTYQQLPEIAEYYTAENSSIWQMFHEESPKWVHELADKLPHDYEHCVVSVIRVDPGQTIPLHQDKHYWVQQTFGQGKTHRYLIMLEDWQSGHYFELNEQPVVQWQAGDYVRFTQPEWHLGSNAGVTPWYTAQVTCVVKD